MRADRLLSILLLLQVNTRITARELAQRLEVSERTIHRDMEALGASGVPVLAERGSGGGWSLMESYRTNLTGLNEAEVRALFLAAPLPMLDDLGLRRAADGALIKLLAALPALSRHNAEFARQHIHVDGAGWKGAAETVPFLPVIHDAIWQGRQLVLSYQRGDGTVVERQVHPLGLVAKGQLWYLVAGIEGDIRSYRVSRVRAAELAAEPSERPAGFDLAAHWEQASVAFKANLPRYPLLLRADESGLGRLRQARYARIESIGAPDAEGWMEIELDCEVEHEALAVVLSCGTHAEVLRPATLRDRVALAAARIAELHSRQR